MFAELRRRGIEASPGPCLSHSGGFAALLTGCRGRAGVDLEWVRPRDVESLADLAYSPEECAWLRGLDPVARQAGFVELWVLKEAAAKALGLDLFTALRRCTFEIRGDGGIEGHLPGAIDCECRLYAPRPALRAAWVELTDSLMLPAKSKPALVEIRPHVRNKERTQNQNQPPTCRVRGGQRAGNN